jgi:dynein heavy chain
VYDEEMLL